MICSASSIWPAQNRGIWRHSRKRQSFHPVPALKASLIRCSLLNTQSRCSGDPYQKALRDAVSIGSPTG